MQLPTFLTKMSSKHSLTAIKSSVSLSNVESLLTTHYRQSTSRPSRSQITNQSKTSTNDVQSWLNLFSVPVGPESKIKGVQRKLVEELNSEVPEHIKNSLEVEVLPILKVS